MRLYVETMDAHLVEFTERGAVRFESEPWSTPTIQQTRAILHAAEQQVAWLQELIQAMEDRVRPGGAGGAP